MKWRRIPALAGMMVLLMLAWFAWPVYQFYGHRGQVPLGPLGWHSLPENAPSAEILEDTAYRAHAQRAMEALQAHRTRMGLPALSAAVAIGGKRVWAGTVGWEDIESETPATPETMFRIGSTSKAVTATGLARLVDGGHIDLDTSIEAYLNPLPNEAWSSITPRMLASHTAGLPHYGENTDGAGLYRAVALRTEYKTMREALDVFDGSEMLHAPGTAFRYSSLGTVLLGAVMGAATERSYRQVMHEQVFEPLGLTSIIVAPPSARGTPHMATSYVRQGNRFRPWRRVDQTHRLPAGGWAATSSDLARMGSAWLDEAFIDPATRERFWTPQRLVSGEVNPQDYALGFRVRAYPVVGIGEAWNANHGGVSRGGMSWLMIFPGFDMVLAFNTNAKPESGQFQDFGVAWQDLFAAFAQTSGQTSRAGSGGG